MLVDLLSSSNYCMFNVKLANKLGLEEAIYISELLNVNSKAIKKDKLTNDKYFNLDRGYIKSRTTFTTQKQLEIEKGLFNVGVLEKGKDNNSLSINLSCITSILMEDNEQLIQDLKKLIADKKSKKTKKEVIGENLKKHIQVTEPSLRKAYCDWIDSVMSKGTWLSVKTLELAEETINSFTDRELDVALKILEIAAANGYRDITWAIKLYKQNYMVTLKPKEPSKVTTSFHKDNLDLSQESF